MKRKRDHRSQKYLCCLYTVLLKERLALLLRLSFLVTGVRRYSADQIKQTKVGWVNSGNERRVN